MRITNVQDGVNMDHSFIPINDLREVISNLQYLIEVSTDRSKTEEYKKQIETFKMCLAAEMTEASSPHL